MMMHSNAGFASLYLSALHRRLCNICRLQTAGHACAESGREGGATKFLLQQFGSKDALLPYFSPLQVVTLLLNRFITEL
jgi:hypothetical protein